MKSSQFVTVFMSNLLVAALTRPQLKKQRMGERQ